MPVDPHVHLRGSEYDVNYVAMGLIDMKAAGIAAFCEMPNTTPAITYKDAILDRGRQVDRIAYDVGYRPKHFIHVGMTNNLNQVRSALEYMQQPNRFTAADKVFYTHSTGNMGILDPEIQREIWKIKGQMNYRGVSIGHFEDEKLFTVPFNPADPISQSLRQNEEAETIQVEAQLKNAFDARFAGTFYIAHVSSPETVNLVEKLARTLPFKIVVEATFHHLFLNWEDYSIHGNLVKMNPPLRHPGQQQRLVNQLLQGKIDIIGTDHAPHPLSAKKGEKPPSGIPALPFWPKAVEILMKDYGMTRGHLYDLIFHKANDVFEMGLEETEVETQYDPAAWDKYGWNPFSRIDGTLAESLANIGVGFINDREIARVDFSMQDESHRMPHPGPEVKRGPHAGPQKLGL